MFIIIGLLLGAAIGAARAKQLGGKPMDLLQYAAAHAIAFGLIALVITLIWMRNGA